ncbi:MAG: hypothetical protein AABZ14_07545 [Candidatus Margulisiibacteriota bacterium]
MKSKVIAEGESRRSQLPVETLTLSEVRCFMEAYKKPDHCGYDVDLVEQLWIPIDVSYIFFLRPRKHAFIAVVVEDRPAHFRKRIPRPIDTQTKCCVIRHPVLEGATFIISDPTLKVIHFGKGILRLKDEDQEWNICMENPSKVRDVNAEYALFVQQVGLQDILAKIPAKRVLDNVDLICTTLRTSTGHPNSIANNLFNLKIKGENECLSVVEVAQILCAMGEKNSCTVNEVLGAHFIQKDVREKALTAVGFSIGDINGLRTVDDEWGEWQTLR